MSKCPAEIKSRKLIDFTVKQNVSNCNHSQPTTVHHICSPNCLNQFALGNSTQMSNSSKNVSRKTENYF